jgi:hypothetical protein
VTVRRDGGLMAHAITPGGLVCNEAAARFTRAAADAAVVRERQAAAATAAEPRPWTDDTLF